MIRVINVTKRMQVFNLPHNVMCSKDKCSCATHVHRQSSHNPKTGDVGYRDLERKLSGSAHILPGESADLPDAAEKAPEIASAKSRGDVRIEKVTASAAAA